MENKTLYIYTKKYLISAIVNYLYKHHFHFLILLNSNIQPNASIQKIYIGSIYDLISFLKCSNTNNKNETNKQYYVCIIAKQSKTGIFKRKWIIQKELEKHVPIDYVVNSSFLISKHKRESDQIFVYAETNYSGGNALFLTVGGYGDWFRHSVVLQTFLQSQSEQVEVYHANKYSLKVSKLLLYKYKNKLIPQRFKYRLFKINHYRKVYNLSEISYVASTRLYNLSKYLNGMFIPYPDRNNIDFNSKYQNHRLLNKIRDLKAKYSYIIGIQFYTNHISPNDRNYSMAYAETFIKLCNQNICVLNLAPIPYKMKTSNNFLDISKISLLFMPAIVKELNCIVGIDSCFVHLAGLMQVPSIVLFNKVYAYSLSVIRNNYNLISKSGTNQSLLPCLVYERMIQLMDHKLKVNVEPLIKYNIKTDQNSEII